MLRAAQRKKESRTLHAGINAATELTRRVVHQMFTKTVVIAKWQFNVFGIVMIAVGMVLGGYVTLSNTFLKHTKALAESTYTVGQGQNAELTSGTGSNVIVTASSITLGKDSAWYDLNWDYKRTLTIKNNSGSTIATGTPVQVSMNTSSLESVLSNCNDLRIVYQNNTELPRSYIPGSGATNCNNSTATIITFPIQADITAGSSDITNYTVYYGNVSASASLFPKEKALTFDGSNDVMTIPASSHLNYGATFTIEAWFKTANTSWTWLVVKSNNSSRLGISNGGKISFAKQTGIDYQGTRTVNDNIWHHVALIYNNGDLNLYTDGTADGSWTGVTLNNTDNLSTLVGSRTIEFFNGSIDEIRIWNAALTQQQVVERMNKELTSSDSLWSNLKGYWKLDEGTGQNVTDSSSSGTTATLGATSSSASDDPTWGIFTNISNSIGTKSATLVCPFNETTTCLDGETASTAAGAIRYSGSKSALRFDGVDDSISLATFSTSGFTQITLESWVYIQKYVTDSGPARIVDLNNEHLLRINSDGRIDFCITTSSTDCNTISGSAISLNTWHHIAGTWDGTTKRLFIDGTLSDSDAFTGTLTAGGQTGIGGTRGGSTIRLWQGLLDEFRISNSSRYNANFTASSTNFEQDVNTKLLYHFDENGSDPRNAGKAIDASGNGNHGTLTNAPTYVSGLVGIDASTTDTGKVPTQSYASHQGIFLEGGTTNLITNPSFETGASWGGVSTTRTQDLTTSKFGSASMKVVGDGADPLARAFLSFAFTPSTTYTLSAWVKTDTGTATGVKLRLIETGGTSAESGFFTATTEWQRITFTTATSAGTTTAYFAMYVQNQGAFNKTVFIDGVQVEQKSFATTYADGSLGTGYAWTGTAHASTSTRTLGNITYPMASNFNINKGTLSFWVKPNWNGDDNQIHSFTQNYVDSSNYFQIEKNLNNTIRIVYKSAGVNRISLAPSSTAWTANTWYHVVVVWDNSAPVTGTSYGSVFINNTRTNDSTSSASFPGFTPTSTFMVSHNNDLYPANSVFSDYRIYDQPLSDSEVSSLYNIGLANNAVSATNQGKYTNSGSWTSPAIDLTSAGAWGSEPNFTRTEILSGNSISYETRTSTDGNTWSPYVHVQNEDSIQSTAERYLQVKATLTSTNQMTTPSLSGMSIRYIEDSTPPSANADTIVMQRNASGPNLVSNDWTIDQSPYFTWSPGADAVALKGYCVYLGTDPNGDPGTSKGLLGTSPISTTSSSCQFITSNTSLDFADAALRGSSWLSSSTDPYYLNIKAVDNTGNLYPTSEQFQFRFDNTAAINPSGLSAPQSFQRELSSFTINWPVTGTNIASDAYSGVKGYQYKIGASGLWQGANHTGTQDCSDVLTGGSYTLNSEFDELAIGENIFYLRTLDNACNINQNPVSVILKYSADAPSAPQTLEVTPEINTKNLFAFSWTKPTTFSGQESGLSYCYTVNTFPSAENCIWTQSTSLDADAYATQPGKNILYIITKDEAGNVNYDDYATINFYANTSAPSISRNLDISDASIKLTQNWKLTVSWDEPEETGAGIRSYKIYRATENLSCSSDFPKFKNIATTSGTSYVDSGLSQKEYYYCVKACDSANNCSASSNTVHKTPTGRYTDPAGLVSQPISLNVSTRKATIFWTTDRSSDSRLSFGTKSNTYNKVEAANSEQTKEHSLTLTNLQPGTTYYYQAKWTDEDGNIGTSEEKTFTTSPAPVISEATTKNISISSATVHFSSKGSSNVRMYFGKSSSFGGVKETATSSLESSYNLDLTSLEDNTKYYFKLNTFDADGNEYEGNIYSFTTLPRPRITNVKVQEVKGAAQPTVLVTWTSNTEISSIISYSPEGSRSLSRDEINLNATKDHKMYLKGLMAGSMYLMEVRGSDKVGNEATSDSVKFSTSSDTRPATISNMKIEGSPVPAVARSGEAVTAQLVISWDTDEPTTSQVEFGEGSSSNYSNKTQEDTNLTYNHIVVISNLTPSKVYHLRVVSKDKAGNEGKSSDTITITPKATQSALDLVIGNLSDVFKFFSF